MNRFGVLSLVLWGAFALRALIDRTLLDELEPLPLVAPLSELPMDAIGPRWDGRDVPLEDAILERTGVSAYILRSYRRDDRPLWFYVAYVSGASPRGIHHPGVCFPASGLTLMKGQVVRIPVPGLPDPPVFKEYVWTHLDGTRAYTLTTFYYNGAFEPEEWRLRAARLFRLRYFAIITVSVAASGSLEEARGVCEEVLRTSLPRLLRHFPESGDSRSTR